MPVTHWICPVCQLPLGLAERTLHCDNGHCFDRSKEGYINLLLASQKRSADPGDDRAMLQSRRAFLDRGYYASLADGLTEAVRAACPDDARPCSLLDLGCGEGYYTARLAGALAERPGGGWAGGIDISREGVRLAAKRYGQADFAVASSARLPVADASLDVVTAVFAPSDTTEVRRVLRPGGHYLRVTPGPRHLFELRALVYDNPHEHAAPAIELPGLAHVDTRRISYSMTVDGPGDVGRLLVMTPYYWQAPRARQQAIEHLETLTLQADFRLDLFRA